MPRPLIVELAPGVRGIEIPSPFDPRRHVIHPPALLVSAEPLAVHSKGPAWSPIVSFPTAPFACETPPGYALLGWLVRVHVEVTSGVAALTHATSGNADHATAIELEPGEGWFDVLLDAHIREVEVVLLRSTFARRTDLRVRGFRCFAVLDDETEPLAAPAWRSFDLSAGWSRAYGKASDDLQSRVRDLRFRQLTAPRVMLWVEQLELLIAPRERISRAVYLSGKYEPCTLAVLRRILKPGDVFIDAGANIGLFTMLASRWVGSRGRVISFEPSRREFDRLQQHVERNALDNVVAMPVALGDRDGTALLHVADTTQSGLNTLANQFAYEAVAEAYTETVPVARLDDVLAGEGVEHVGAIKIDVEGGEHQVLEGARQSIVRDRPSLLLEIGSSPGEDVPERLRATEAFLHGVGYAFVAIDGETGTLRHVAHLTGEVENMLAALPEVIAALDRELPIADWPQATPDGRRVTVPGALEPPYLSIVLTGRNDDFGGAFNERLFRALEFNHRHLSERGISHEFIFVEWRPLAGKPWLAEVLADRYAGLVPHTLTSYVADLAYHDAYSLNPRLQFQEFIAKNIGIRRCRGAYILTTNTDIYLGRGVLDRLERRALEPRTLYRVPRVDLKDSIDYGVIDWSVLEDERNYDVVNEIRPPHYTNASGDFLLLDRDSYLELRGFNEVYRVAKIHLDGNFCIKAHSCGFKIVALDSPVYHVGRGTLHAHTSLYAKRPADAPWGDRRWSGTVIYENPPEWGLSRAPARERRPGVHYLDFSWEAVPPAVALRRIVSPVSPLSPY